MPTSLKGYVTATYQELVEAFGEPTYLTYGPDSDEYYGEDKVETEWEWVDDPCGRITIYDWKCYDGGRTSRSGQPYRWHIGGTSYWAIQVVADRLKKPTQYA
jgi:hypothetical protein